MTFSLEGDATPIQYSAGGWRAKCGPTYREPSPPYVNRVTPWDAKLRLESSIHDRHDVPSVGPGSRPRFAEIGKKKRADLGLHETREIDGSVRERFARNWI